MVAMSAWLLCAATGIKSVRSTDTSKTSNTVSIELSDPAGYNVEKLPGGNGIRLTIKDVKSLGDNPQYPRLSEVIDVVSARMEGGNAIIDIKTMGDYDISHQASSGKQRITVSIKTAPAAHATPKTVQSPPKAPKTVIPPEAMPKKAGQPEFVSRRPAMPAPQTSRPAPLVSKPPTKQLPPATNQQPEQPMPRVEETNPPEQSSPEIPAEMESAPSPATSETNPETKNKSNLPLYMILAAAALLILVVILKFFKGPKQVADIPVNKSSASPAEGRTLLLDPETRRRMVQKLLDQGWSSNEIAREMRLGVREVEEIVAELKRVK